MATSEHNSIILTPLINTVINEELYLDKNLLIKNLTAEDLPDSKSKEIVRLIHPELKETSDFAGIISLCNSTENIENQIDKHHKQLSIFRVLYWGFSGIPIDSSHTLVISKNKTQEWVETNHCFDPHTTLRKGNNYGIIQEVIERVSSSMTLMNRIENLEKVLDVFFELSSIAFSTKSRNVRIAIFLSALESLLLPGVNTELRYQTALRVILLSGNNLKEELRIKYFNFVKSLYDLRSKLYHGESINLQTFKVKGEEYQSNEILRNILLLVFRTFFESEELMLKRVDKIDWNNYFLTKSLIITPPPTKSPE